MRREGFELTISPPRVLSRVSEAGVKEEPYEEVTIDMPPSLAGKVISGLQERGGEMLHLRQDDHRFFLFLFGLTARAKILPVVGIYNSSARVVFLISSRGLMGYRSEIKTQTSGAAVLFSTFDSYK